MQGEEERGKKMDAVLQIRGQWRSQLSTVVDSRSTAGGHTGMGRKEEKARA